eukprot:TRINITY_DN7466_c0_g1_i1.p1 TRINITY_DN7466_c0_g1~~TRINITY_DN7466_c0_g1_i1.p1  ORF type:complete len:327 (+),score=82.08 TRINITY_DN7466_c0_g1_i1:201-1181(+)
MSIPDPRLNKVLTAFKMEQCWPALQQAGVRNIVDLANLSDQKIVSICRIPLPVMGKLRDVLNKVMKARAEKKQASAAAPASAANPFGDPAPPPRPAQPKTPSRVLNLAPAPDDQPPAVSNAPRPGRSAPTPPSAARPNAGKKPASNGHSKTNGHSNGQRKPARRMSKLGEDEIDPAVIAAAMPIVTYEGYATKCGGKVKSWQRRYFILRADGTLTYAKEGSLTVPKGVIPLKAATAINGPGNCNWDVDDKAPKEATPMVRFEIVTPERTYKLFCDDQQTAAEWARQIEKVRQRSLTNANPAPKSQDEVMHGKGFQMMLAQLQAVNS